MSCWLSQAHVGKKKNPRRILLYGTQGIGKSTFGASAPKPLFLKTEDGVDDIDCISIPNEGRFESYLDFIACLGEVYSGDHDRETLVIDSADWLERLIHADVCRIKKINLITDVDFHKGYEAALSQWNEVIAGLEAIRLKRGMTIILLAHTAVEKFKEPGQETYDRYSPRLHKYALPMIREWCDEILFANYKVFTRASDEGFGKERHKGVGTGERVLYTAERPAHIAKNRIAGLPAELPFDLDAWQAYSYYLNASQGTT